MDIVWWMRSQMGATLLADLVSDFPASLDPALLVGLAPFDDAAVYQVTDDVALVSTTDFFRHSLMTQVILVRLPQPMHAATCSQWVAVW